MVDKSFEMYVVKSRISLIDVCVWVNATYYVDFNIGHFTDNFKNVMKPFSPVYLTDKQQSKYIVVPRDFVYFAELLNINPIGKDFNFGLIYSAIYQAFFYEIRSGKKIVGTCDIRQNITNYFIIPQNRIFCIEICMLELLHVLFIYFAHIRP